MIDPSACDICHGSMTAQVFEIQLMRGAIVARANQRWSVATRPGGIHLYLACKPCGDHILRIASDQEQQAGAERIA